MKRAWGGVWLRHCTTGFFSDIFPSDRTMALGLTHPLVKMSTRNISGVKAAGA
jgi:hypothetical protein